MEQTIDLGPGLVRRQNGSKISFRRVGQIAPGAKISTRPANDQTACIVVGLRLLNRLDQAVNDARIQGIALLRAIENKSCNAVLLADLNHFAPS
mgnify:CR=1 FL=1